MKNIGLIGGMSWESSSEYYRIINETIREKLGGYHSARCILYSVDFSEIEILQRQDKWDEAAELLVSAGQSLERGGADFIILCANTMHKLADKIQANTHIPLLHIADATSRKVLDAGITRIGLLGTRYTMQQDFYKGRLKRNFGIDVITPDAQDQDLVHQVIFDELCMGMIRDKSREQFRKIISKLVKAGAGGIILGCTEIELLVKEQDSEVPLFPTTRIHALAAVEFALS